MWGKLEISFWMALFLYCNDNNDNTGTCRKLIKSSIFGHAGRQGVFHVQVYKFFYLVISSWFGECVVGAVFHRWRAALLST